MQHALNARSNILLHMCNLCKYPLQIKSVQNYSNAWNPTCNSEASQLVQLQAVNLNKKAVLSQRWPRNAPHTWVPWKFSGLPDYAHSYFSQNFSWAFLLIQPMNVRTKFKVCSFTRSWDNRGYPKIWAVPHKFLMGFSSDACYECTCQIKRRTDRRTTCDRKTTLCTKDAVKNIPKTFPLQWSLSIVYRTVHIYLYVH